MKVLSRISLILSLFVFTLTAGAQRPAFNKMSSMVREACQSVSNVGGKRMVKAKDQRKMIAFVKLSGSNTDALTDNDCRVLAQFGSLCIAEIPLNRIAQLSLDNHVSRIEAQRGTTTMLDTTAIIVNAVPVHEGIGLPQGYTGKGVVVGVQDIGFDLTHPTFWSSDMSTYRVKAMWDQLSYDTLGSTLPAGRDYVGQEALLEVQHPRDGLIQFHGTHTAGIAAGSGAEGDGMVSPYKGIAYDADICLVCNATGNDASIIDEKDNYKYTYALDALGFKYIFDYADRVGKPCVINFSEGSPMDFRGDDLLYYEMLDSLVGPGHIIVASSGNMGGGVTYVRKEADTNETSIACARGEKYMYATTKSKGNFTFCPSLTNGSSTLKKEIELSTVLSSPDSTYTDSIVGDGFVNKIIATAYRSCYDSTDIVCDWQINRDSLGRGNDWKLSIGLRGDGLIEMFPVAGAFYHADGSSIEGENRYSVVSPGSAPSVISVGYTVYYRGWRNINGDRFTNYSPELAATNGTRIVYSSVGPTYDGRIKPDVMAPGENLASAYNSFYFENNPGESNRVVRTFQYNGRTYGWYVTGGSSMAAPVVTGIIALWLQADPKLTPQDCLDIFAKTATHYDKSLTYPNNYYGYGQIDAEAGMKLVLEKAASGIKEIKTNKKADERIYTLDGRYVGKDAGVLPHGIYILNGNKFVK